jgi:cell division septum initiation protein DivIVA
MELIKKRINTNDDAARTRLKDNPRYSECLATLDRLTSDLERHKARTDQLKQQACRLGAGARQFVSREATALPMLTQAAFDALAKKAAAASSDDLLKEIADVRRDGKETRQIPVPILGQYGDETDVQHIENLDVERAAVILLERAIELQRNDVLRVKNIAMAEIMINLKPRFEAISRKIANALMGLASALKEERRFVVELTVQDSAFADALNLKPLSRAELLTSPAVTAWLADAVKSGIIDQQAAYDLAPSGDAA